MLLTIGIPVYNGEKYIEETISAVFAANFDPLKTEIIVSDNCSTDGTLQLLKKYDNITVFEHDENVGFDRNVDRLFKYAQGRYVWTLGADDVLLSNDFTELMNIIKEQTDYSIIFAGEPEQISNKKLEAEEFLYKSHFRSGFISNNIINKKLWLECDAKDFFDSGWVHYGMVLKMLKKAPARMLSKVYVAEIEETKHNKFWVKNGQEILIGLNLVDIFDRMEQWGYSPKMKRRCKIIIKGAYPKALILAKTSGFDIDLNILRRFIRLYHEFASFWLVDMPILITPNFLFSLPFSLYKNLKRNA